jgi:hypothetical protein
MKPIEMNYNFNYLSNATGPLFLQFFYKFWHVYLALCKIQIQVNSKTLKNYPFWVKPILLALFKYWASRIISFSLCSWKLVTVCVMCVSHEMLYQNFCLFKIFDQLFLVKMANLCFGKKIPLPLKLSSFVFSSFPKVWYMVYFPFLV